MIPDWQIQKLCDRVASSTLLEDRRDAVRALKSLSKVKYKTKLLETGAVEMHPVASLLETPF